MSDKDIKNKSEEENDVELKSDDQSEDDIEETFTVTGLVFEWANVFIIAIIFVVLIFTFVFRQVTVDGESMTDTLKNGDRLVHTAIRRYSCYKSR